MMRIGKICLIILLMLLSTTGCWDMKEPDSLAFELGAGLDRTDEGKFLISLQVVVPSSAGGQGASGGGEKQNSRIIAATGKDVIDTLPKLQKQLSRRIFFGHRQIMVVGKSLAEHGISTVFDEFVRNPQSEMRSRMFVAENCQAIDLLSVEPTFDNVISTQLMHLEEPLGIKPYYYHSFLSDTLGQGIEPMLSAISLTPAKQIVYTGSAIFNKENGLKLVGFLNTKEAFYANWLAYRQASFDITSYIPTGKGTVSLELKKLKRRFRVKIVNGQIYIDVHLDGDGTIVENNSYLNPTKRKDLQIIQNEINKSTQKQVLQMIRKVQKQYKSDIFGFGESVHQQYPQQWKTLKQNWDDIFPDLHVSLKVDLKCKDPGESNLSLKLIP